MRAVAPLAALAVSLFAAGCKGMDTGVHWDLERMLVQPRFRAFGESRFFADARMMRPPPDGAIPADPPPRDVAAPGAMVAGSYRDRIPVPVTMDLLRLGRERFDVVCAACHGVLGDGASAVAVHMTLRPPPPLLTANVRAMPVGRLFRIVEEGYGLMPSYADVLSPVERWAVVAYVRALQLSQSAALAELPPALRAEAIRALEPAGRAP